MTSVATEKRVLERHLPHERATARLGEDIAMALRTGDVLAISGDLGAGKTTLARGLIRAMAEDAALDVPSPTFTLVQSYETRIPLHHFDLYRLSSPSELDELGLDEMLTTGAALVEWPERAGGLLPKEAVEVELTHDGEGRLARIAGSGPAFERIARSLGLRDFLADAGWGEAERRYFTGDASARSYETVTLPGEEPRVLMNSPRLVLGPPVRDGKPYAIIAHTAQSVAAFVAIDRALAEVGVSVPEIYAERSRPRFSADQPSRLGKFPRRRGAACRGALCRGGGTSGGDPRERMALAAGGGAWSLPRASALRPRRHDDRGRAAGRLVRALRIPAGLPANPFAPVFARHGTPSSTGSTAPKRA